MHEENVITLLVFVKSCQGNDVDTVKPLQFTDGMRGEGERGAGLVA